MELSYIFYQLKASGAALWSKACTSKHRVDAFLVWEENQILDKNTLYLLEEEQADVLGQTLRNIPVLVRCKAGELPNLHYGIFIKNEISQASLINVLSGIFLKFQALQLALKQQEPDLRGVMNQISNTLHAAAAVIGGDFEAIAYSDSLNEIPVLTDAAEADNLKKQMIWDRSFYEVQEKQQVFLYENELLASQITHMLCRNLFVKGRFYARFAIIFSEDWKINYLKSATDMIGRELEAYFQAVEAKSRVFQKTQAFQNAMLAVVNGKKPEELLALNQSGWYEEQQYQVYVFRFDTRYPMKTGREYLLNELEAVLGECYITEQHAEVICVCNRSISPYTADKSHELLVSFLREYIAKAGISHCFWNLFEVPRYIRQARWAMKLGEEKSPTHWYFQFQDYTYEYILEQSVTEFPAEQLIIPELYTLLERDREKGSSLFATLEAYVRMKCNGQATAKQLFIHRTTFLYRMKQIRELTSLDIQNEEVYKRILLSLEL